MLSRIISAEGEIADSQCLNRRSKCGHEKHPSQGQHGIHAKLAEPEDITQRTELQVKWQDIKTTPKENRGSMNVPEQWTEH